MRVAVIGAGASGLAAAKALVEVGLNPVVYEASAEIGGLWVYRERGGGPAYRSLRTNTSKQVTAFSDLPFDADLPDFPARAMVESYLRTYAERFELRPLIRFGCWVSGVRPADDGGWVLALTMAGGKEERERFDAVLVCTGIFSQPHRPTLAELEGFAGDVLHSIDYRAPEAFAGRDVLVVGLGSSAVDVAIDLAGNARRVTVSTRRAVMIVPRTIDGRPLDHHLSRLVMRLSAQRRDRWRRQLVLEEYRRRGIDDPLAIWRRAGMPFDPATAGGVASDELLARVMSGEIGLKPAIARIDGPEVVFVDGSRQRPDTIILCTGYDLDFPFLPPALRPWTDEGSGLYRLVFPPDHPTLPFIGVCRAQGPILPIVEMQARWAAQVLAGTIRLPAPAAMRAEIAARHRRQAARKDSPIRVVLLPYLDELGGEIGVRPRLWRHPLLLRALLTGPPVAAQYRLDGPHRWSGAADVIRESVTLRRSMTFHS